MQVFYFNLPWIIDPAEYNCSSRPYSEWVSRGSVNLAQGTYFATTGVIFVTLYVLCLIGMFRGRLLKIPCYRLMFFNGFIDILDLFIGSFFTAYFHFTGAVFCSTMIFNWIAGHMAWSAWCGASFNCIVLALNRVVEMTPELHRLRFLFRGKSLYMWMFLCVFYMILRPFISRSIPYNTVVSAYIGSPVTTDDPEWEVVYYALLFLPIHNLTVLVVLVTMYPLLCYRVVSIARIANGGLDKTQIQEVFISYLHIRKQPAQAPQETAVYHHERKRRVTGSLLLDHSNNTPITLFIQALLICATTAITAVLYLYLEFFTASREIVIAANVIWQLSHGLHGVVYLCFNLHIRREVKALFVNSPRNPSTITISVTTAIG